MAFVLNAELALNVNKAQLASAKRQIDSGLKSTSVDIRARVSPQAIRESRRLTDSLKDIKKEAKASSDSIEEFGRRISLAGKRYLAFSLATVGVVRGLAALREGFSNVVDFERQIVKIGQVSGRSLKQLSGLRQEILATTAQLGVDSQEIAESAVTLAQTGRPLAQIRKDLEAIAKARLAPTFGSAKQTVEGLIAVQNQFGDTAGTTEQILSKLNAVAARFPVEAGDLTTAVQKAGGAFVSAGGSLEELLSLFTAVRATTRESADTIGTSFRTITGRLARVDTREFIKKNLGLDLVQNGQLLTPFEAILNISKEIRRQGIGERSPLFAQIVEQLGGIRQRAKVIPLLRETAKAEQVLNTIRSSGNTISRDAEAAQESLSVQIQSVREEFRKFIDNVLQDPAFRSFTGQLLDITKGLIRIADATRPLIPLFGVLGTVFAGRALVGGSAGKFAGSIFGKTKLNRGGFPSVGNRDIVPALIRPDELVLNPIQQNNIADMVGGNTRDVFKAAGVPRLTGGGGVGRGPRFVGLTRGREDRSSEAIVGSFSGFVSAFEGFVNQFGFNSNQLVSGFKDLTASQKQAARKKGINALGGFDTRSRRVLINEASATFGTVKEEAIHAIDLALGRGFGGSRFASEIEGTLQNALVKKFRPIVTREVTAQAERISDPKRREAFIKNRTSSQEIFSAAVRRQNLGAIKTLLSTTDPNTVVRGSRAKLAPVPSRPSDTKRLGIGKRRGVKTLLDDFLPVVGSAEIKKRLGVDRIKKFLDETSKSRIFDQFDREQRDRRAERIRAFLGNRIPSTPSIPPPDPDDVRRRFVQLKRSGRPPLDIVGSRDFNGGFGFSDPGQRFRNRLGGIGRGIAGFGGGVIDRVGGLSGNFGALAGIAGIAAFSSGILDDNPQLQEIASAVGAGAIQVGILNQALNNSSGILKKRETLEKQLQASQVTTNIATANSNKIQEAKLRVERAKAAGDKNLLTIEEKNLQSLKNRSKQLNTLSAAESKVIKRSQERLRAEQRKNTGIVAAAAALSVGGATLSSIGRSEIKQGQESGLLKSGIGGGLVGAGTGLSAGALIGPQAALFGLVGGALTGLVVSTNNATDALDNFRDEASNRFLEASKTGFADETGKFSTKLLKDLEADVKRNRFEANNEKSTLQTTGENLGRIGSDFGRSVGRTIDSLIGRSSIIADLEKTSPAGSVFNPFEILSDGNNAFKEAGALQRNVISQEKSLSSIQRGRKQRQGLVNSFSEFEGSFLDFTSQFSGIINDTVRKLNPRTKDLTDVTKLFLTGLEKDFNEVQKIVGDARSIFVGQQQAIFQFFDGMNKFVQGVGVRIEALQGLTNKNNFLAGGNLNQQSFSGRIANIGSVPDKLINGLRLPGSQREQVENRALGLGNLFGTDIGKNFVEVSKILPKIDEFVVGLSGGGPIDNNTLTSAIQGVTGGKGGIINDIFKRAAEVAFPEGTVGSTIDIAQKIQEISASFNPIIQNQLRLNQIYENQISALDANFAKERQMRERLAQGRLNQVNIREQTAGIVSRLTGGRFQGGFEAQRRGAITGGLNAQQLGANLRGAQDRLLQVNARRDALGPNAGVDQLVELSRQRSIEIQNINNASNALKFLTDVTGRSAEAQQRFTQAQQDRLAKAGLLEPIAAGTPQEARQRIRDLTATQALSAGQIQASDLNGEQFRRILGLARGVGDAQLGSTGKTGTQFAQDLLAQRAEVEFAKQGIDPKLASVFNTPSAAEQKELQNIQQSTKEAGDAQRELNTILGQQITEFAQGSREAFEAAFSEIKAEKVIIQAAEIEGGRERDQFNQQLAEAISAFPEQIGFDGNLNLNVNLNGGSFLSEIEGNIRDIATGIVREQMDKLTSQLNIQRIS